MKRREFVASGLAGALALQAQPARSALSEEAEISDIRAAFPRMQKENYLNAASTIPLGSFTRSGMQRYMDYQQIGDNVDYYRGMWSEIRGLFGRLIGADQDEIGLVHCTKAGEQIALDAVDAIKKNGNIVTNDLHFSGSLHNMTGLKKAGRDIRIVRARDWRIQLEDMKAAIDGDTALVHITLVSNINGHIEDVRAIADMAHAQGALLYVDIIQAAGIYPIDVHKMGIDIAACSGYKWLYGVFGAGFLYVRKEIQGERLPDLLHPGRVRYNYAPWIDKPDPTEEALGFRPNRDASRYESGHVNYMGYCGAYESLKFLLNHGVERALAHSIKLNQRLFEKVDPKRYVCISPHRDRSSIITFTHREQELAARLKQANIKVTLVANRMRVSPALYNRESDIDALAVVLNT